MSPKGSQYRNIVLISQVSISLMVPIFVCVALGVWLDKQFGTWFTLPLVFLGIGAGARNAYVLVMNVVRSEEKRSKEQQEREIQRKVEEASQTKQHD